MSEGANIASLGARSAMEETAAAWVALEARDGLSDDARAEFETWMAEDSQHRELVEELRAVWRNLDGLEALDDYPLPPEADAPSPAVVSGAEEPRPWHSRRGALAAIAATLALVVTGVVLMRGPAVNGIQQGVFETALGEQETITLADTSTVILNTNSRIDVSYGADARVVRLISGEAHFDVAPDGDRPFSVLAGDGVVRAVGTAFTVHLRDEGVEVTVAEGRVALLAQAEPAVLNGSSDVSISEPLAEIGAGDNAVFGDAKIEEVVPLSVRELNRKLSWRRGRIVFEGEPLAEVIAEIGRYTDISIEVSDPTIENVPIGGAFRVGEVDELLVALEDAFGIEVQRINDKRVTLSRAL